MGYLIRKINRGKWNVCAENRAIHPPADAITLCLKTTKNTLSVWFAHDDNDGLRKAKIALIGTQDKIEAIDIVILKVEDVNNEGLTLESTPGHTKATPLIDLHRDLTELTIDGLKKISLLVQSELINQKNYRITRPEMKALIKEAVEQGFLDSSVLPDDFLTALA